MEKSIITPAAYLREAFQISGQDVRTYSPLTLAYIGDAVYEIIIRTVIVEQGNAPVNKLHKAFGCLSQGAGAGGDDVCD